MSEEMIALLITVVVALVLWIPSLHIIGRAAKHARASPQAGKSQLKQEAESTDREKGIRAMGESRSLSDSSRLTNKQQDGENMYPNVSQFSAGRASSSLAIRLFLLTLGLFATFIAVQPSHASWGAFTSTGTATGIGNPSCAHISSETVACAVMSGKSTMMVNQYSDGVWGTWQSLPGTIASSPSCTADGTGKIFCVATAASGDLEVSILTGTSWSTPTDVTASLYSAPSCAEYLTGEVLCVARNSTGGVASSLYSDSKWSTFANLSTTAISLPNCISDHNSGVICSFLTLGGATIVDRFAGGGWKGLINIGGIAGGATNCSYLQPTGEVECFVRGTESGIVFMSYFNGGAWTASNWTAYDSLGGIVNDDASCASQTSGELACGAISPIGNNEFYANVYKGGNWSGWEGIGGKSLGSPSCTPLNTGKVLCLLLGTNNELTSIVGP